MNLSYATAKARREARTGYVTLEGFWEDPPGYVDNVVWPNYVKDHSQLFENGDVEGHPKEDICQRMGLHMMPDPPHDDMTSCLEWACEIIQTCLKTQDEI